MGNCMNSQEGCPISLAQSMIGGKWKMAIIWLLGEKTCRFNELQKALPGVTQKMLTHQLRELEAHQLLDRKVYPIIPPKVEYSLTDIGRKLLPIFDEMCAWGMEYLECTSSRSLTPIE